MTHFRANGKLLLTAEYSVLRGAIALALPTRVGQTLTLAPSEDDLLHWQSAESNGDVWFRAIFNTDFTIEKTSEVESATSLAKLLKTASEINPKFMPFGVSAKTSVEFNRAWGFGSSSTLVALVAQWANVDALTLFFASQTGSGYDVAAGLSASPILYQLAANHRAVVAPVQFHPSFAEDLVFVYLGQKQQSHTEVARFAARKIATQNIEAISNLTTKMIAATDLRDFERLMKSHETRTAEILGQTPIQAQKFSDYPGAVKSLGAWGGDFIMATRAEIATAYFPQRGYTTLLRWHDLFTF